MSRFSIWETALEVEHVASSLRRQCKESGLSDSTRWISVCMVIDCERQMVGVDLRIKAFLWWWGTNTVDGRDSPKSLCQYWPFIADWVLATIRLIKYSLFSVFLLSAAFINSQWAPNLHLRAAAMPGCMISSRFLVLDGEKVGSVNLGIFRPYLNFHL